MDLRKIKKLIDLLEESNLAEIEIKEGEESVRLARVPKGNYSAAPVYASAPAEARPAAAPASTLSDSAATGSAKPANLSGTVLAVLTESGSPVEFDQPLFVIG